MQKPKVVIYDNDGMIIHGGRFSEKYVHEFGIDKTVMDSFFDGPFKKCLIGQADLKEELAQVIDDWQWKGTVDELLNYWFSIGAELHQDVYDSILKLREQGDVVCLATNQEKYRTEFMAKRFKYTDLFNEIFSSAFLGAPKHSFDGLKKIHKTLKEKYGITDKNQIIYWDDRADHVERFNEVGFIGQQYTNYDSFRTSMTQFGYLL